MKQNQPQKSDSQVKDRRTLLFNQLAREGQRRAAALLVKDGGRTLINTISGLWMLLIMSTLDFRSKELIDILNLYFELPHWSLSASFQTFFSYDLSSQRKTNQDSFSFSRWNQMSCQNLHIWYQSLFSRVVFKLCS